MARTASTSLLWAKLILRNETVNKPKAISQAARTVVPRSLGLFIGAPSFRVLPCRTARDTSQPRGRAEHSHLCRPAPPELVGTVVRFSRSPRPCPRPVARLRPRPGRPGRGDL